MAQEGPSDFINPIIQAMIATARGKQEAQTLAEQVRSHKEEEAFRTQQLGQAETHFNKQHELSLAQLDAENELRKAQAKSQHIEGISKILDVIGKPGASPELIKAFGGTYTPAQQIIPQSSGGGLQTPAMVGYEGSSFPVTALPDFGRETSEIAQRAGAISSAQLGAKEPFNIAEDARKAANEKAKQEQDQANRLTELGISGKTARDVAGINAASRQSEANLNSYTHLKGIAMMHQFGLDDGTGQASNYAKQLTDNLFNGNADYTKLSQDQKRLVDTYTAGTGEQPPTNGKDYTSKLDTIGNIQNLLDQARHLAVNYSMDAPGGGVKAQARNGQFFGLVPKSPLNSELDTFKTSGGQLASTFDQQNRKSDAEIIRQTTGLFDPKATVEENVRKIQQQRDKLNQIVKNTFSGFSTDRVNSILSQRGIKDFGDAGAGIPDWLKNAPQKSAKGGTLDPQKSIELGQPVYK